MVEEGHSNESSSDNHNNKKSSKTKKLIILISIILLLQITTITIIRLVVFRVRSPKLRLAEINLQTLEYTKNPASFEAAFGAKVTIKNPNFGQFIYETSSVSFVFEGIIVGQVFVPAGKVKKRSTKIVEVFTAVSSKNLAGLAGESVSEEIGIGVLSLAGKGVMRGKVKILGVVKKKEEIEMDCFIVFSLALKNVQRLDCQLL